MADKTEQAVPLPAPSDETQESTDAGVSDDDRAEALLCARYGETDDLRALLDAKVSVNHQDPYGLSTCLHYAAANGHIECLKLLIERKAAYTANASGNFPLHWALDQSKSLDTVKLLMESYPEIDVLALNSFGKSALTSSFKANNKEFVNLILQHSSAAPLDQNRSKESVMPKTDVTVTHQMAFPTQAQVAAGDKVPVLHVRERAIERSKVFGKEMEASEDATGLALWPASIVLAHWIAQESSRALLRGKRVLELGAGCGLPGLVAASYTSAASVAVTDYFEDTMANLKYNVSANKAAGLIGRGGCKSCTVHQVDWANTALWEASEETRPSFDVVIGADLVYHDDVIPIFLSTLQHVLRDGGRFLYVSRERRGGMALLGPALEMAGFTLRKKEEAPAHLRRNPMPSATQVR